MEQALSAEARGILPGMIVECLDNDPTKRPTAKRLLEALGIYTLHSYSCSHAAHACVKVASLITFRLDALVIIIHFALRITRASS